MPELDARYLALLATREHDPFAILGLHRDGAEWCVRVYRPGASEVLWGEHGHRKLTRVHSAGIFEWRSARRPVTPWKIRVHGRCEYDAYAFGPECSEHDLYLFGEGRNYQSYRFLGAHSEARAGVTGVTFRVWAPTAARVSVVGDFNAWDGRPLQMANLGASGVWTLFVPGLAGDVLYKFEILPRTGQIPFLRADPYARATQSRPATASRVPATEVYGWRDHAWLATRDTQNARTQPINIYEIHAGSWLRHPDGRFYSYAELATRLVPYVVAHGYTHIEFMPLTEHPLDESWGYQTTGYFAPTARFGPGTELKALIDACHAAAIGVILDWVPAHFPADDGALARFDGSPLYEHRDPRVGRHPDWGTYIFDYGRHEVASFLLSSAHYWLREFHFDGLRVDAVASMLYLDYSRRAGEWVPNRYGGRENLEAVDFLRALNAMVHEEFPGALMIAEESTTWPMVTRPPAEGGLGFTFKWNMGWMNDTLRYFTLDPVHRRYHHNLLTFGQLYAYSEQFMLPLSHDEVVHGKRSLLAKMPGDEWRRFANLRLLLTYQMTTPGKKLTFMGNEFGQLREWQVGWELDWALLARPAHAGLDHLNTDLNRLYRRCSALYALDCAPAGFSWLDCDDAERSLLSFVRRDAHGRFLVVVLNFTPVPRADYVIRVPPATRYREIFNSDSEYYGGTNLGNLNLIDVRHGTPMAEIKLNVPPLAGLILEPVED
jgi:1,4-alpha-glucan branching enzyme